MDTLNELLVSSGRGNTQAFQQLYKTASPRLFAVCRRLLRDESLAEDVLQESFIKIWHSAAQFSSSRANAMTWMSTIVRNQAIDRLRSMRRDDVVLDTDDMDYETLDFASLQPQPDAVQQLDEDGKRLLECLECLKPEQRECLLQAYYYGQTHSELAAKLAKPLGTVKAWIRRGLDHLRECLG